MLFFSDYLRCTTRSPYDRPPDDTEVRVVSYPGGLMRRVLQSDSQMKRDVSRVMRAR